MGSECTRLQFLHQVAQEQGVEPSDDDLRAALDFLDAIRPALVRLEELLGPQEDE